LSKRLVIALLASAAVAASVLVAVAAVARSSPPRRVAASVVASTTALRPSSGIDATQVTSSAPASDSPANAVGSSSLGLTLAPPAAKRLESSPTPTPKPPTDPGIPVGAGVGISAAAAYGTSRGYQVGIAVVDTQTGQVWGGGAATTYFASESVVKVFIAAKILVMGQMSGATADTAYKMITQSDDDSADALYGMVGGDSVVTWAASYFHIADLGTPPTRAGWWSNTHITAVGLVQFYSAVKANATVWPWLSDAMAHATTNGSDGTYQYFGIPSATTGWAVKQGWGQDDDDWAASADFNSTGFVNGGRYAVAILVKGPPSGYDVAVPNMLTSIARVLMPGGVCTPGG
jgi:hypothetical protein